MSLLRISVAAVLALSATLAAAQGATPTIEERLQQLEAEQAAMKQQLTERDKLIQDLRREAAGPAGGGRTARHRCRARAPAPPENVAAGAVSQTVDAERETADRRSFTPQVETWGVYDPGKGFRVAKTEFGERNISAYAMARYMNQNDDDGEFTDHLGNVRPVDERQDIFSHRIMVFLKGWLGSEKLIYNITFWTVNTTDQDAIFANLGYQFSRKFSLYAGLTGNPGSRSLSGSHPFGLGHDRVMADEFFRPFFGSGIYATGEALPGLWYTATVSNNNSALGVKANQLDREFTYGGTVFWMPTTHEFGPRGAYWPWSGTRTWPHASACRTSTAPSRAFATPAATRTTPRCGWPTA